MIPSVYAMAADFKYRGMDKYRAWDQYIINTGLKPQIDAKEFYDIFAGVNPEPLCKYELPYGYCPTHRDMFLNQECMITVQDGYYSIVWDNGHTGSNPGKLSDEPTRFIALTNPPNGGD